MGSETVLHWGIISAGKISNDFCVAIQHTDTKYNIISAVAARNENDAKTFAERFNIPAYYGSYDQLYEDKTVNIVYVGSINSTHRDVCLKAIKAGKHVLCEKPFMQNSKELEEVLAAAKEKGVFIMEGLWTRFFPVVQKIKEELNKNTIGEVKFFSGNFILPNKHLDRINNKAYGGGVLLDMGVYPIQMACMIFNHEKPIKIVVTGHMMESGVDECSTIVLLYSNQRIAQMNISSNGAKFAPTFIIGEKGILQIPDYSWCPTELILADGTKFEAPLEEDSRCNYWHCVGFKYEIEAVRDAISKGLTEHPFATHEHSRLINHIIETGKQQIGYVD